MARGHEDPRPRPLAEDIQARDVEPRLLALDLPAHYRHAHALAHRKQRFVQHAADRRTDAST